MTRPHLAVITPSYNDAAFLSECVTTVAASARHAGIRCEHAVVDDGSTDETQTVLGALRAQHPLFVHRFPVNRGASAAMNAAVRLTSAPWLLTLAADDVVPLGALAMVRVAMQAFPTANVFYSDCPMFGARDDVYRPSPFSREELRLRSIIPGCAVFRRTLWEAVGGFDVALRSAMDWDFWVRADYVVGLEPVKLEAPLFRYRRHATSGRLSNASGRNIEAIRAVVRNRTRANSVLPASEAAA
jgi:glycosyltransferase involved in cell wall biosynthesis